MSTGTRHAPRDPRRLRLPRAGRARRNASWEMEFSPARRTQGTDGRENYNSQEAAERGRGWAGTAAKERERPRAGLGRPTDWSGFLLALHRGGCRSTGVSAPSDTSFVFLSSATIMALKEISSNKCFEGFQKVYEHESTELKCKMKFGIYLPPKAQTEKCPVLYWLSGLTCTEQNFITKAGFHQAAAEHGLVVVAPDTSPRGCDIKGEDESWDFGTGAGFYVDATEEPWKTNYRMYTYIKDELPNLINANFPVDSGRMSISGHSMGGHGALILALKNPGRYKSVSAFAPICNPVQCPWGKKAFGGYLGSKVKDWEAYDATHIVKSYEGSPLDILIDQGKDDQFLSAGQLLPDNFIAACTERKVPVVFRMQQGYDHSYYFIATFINDHIRHHAKYLNA
ncbi:hypothetical protein JRQ81_005717 [Phrynocephalus forsythii]|uniref:S-formylglutathione hydrolase n=1 Tax=Phrynocephalus forsythii TaxID=171643 RepID=A0A9Q0Y3X7_9SAUR|nr:hypothetical protein JRQ81_005717 [Phrynocephalus forsythii]